MKHLKKHKEYQINENYKDFDGAEDFDDEAEGESFLEDEAEGEEMDNELLRQEEEMIKRRLNRKTEEKKKSKISKFKDFFKR
jgi:hypothetical protein